MVLCLGETRALFVTLSFIFVQVFTIDYTGVYLFSEKIFILQSLLSNNIFFFILLSESFLLSPLNPLPISMHADLDLFIYANAPHTHFFQTTHTHTLSLSLFLCFSNLYLLRIFVDSSENAPGLLIVNSTTNKVGGRTGTTCYNS